MVYFTHIMLLNLSPLTQSMCLTINGIAACSEFVGSELASEAEML